MPALIDTHCNLDDDRFRKDLRDVLQRAASAGVVHMMTIGVDLATSRAALDLAHRHPQISAVVGIQPNYASEAKPEDKAAIELLAADPRAVAIGETGLDRYWDRAPFDLQVEYFRWHLGLARRLGKPVVIHNRDAGMDVVQVLREDFAAHGAVPGIMHSFSDKEEVARECLALGMHISFAGMVTYKNAKELAAIAKWIPEDRLLVETDSPYLSPEPVRGKRNEPANVLRTALFLATLRGTTPDALSAKTTQNAIDLLGLQVSDAKPD